MSARITMGLDVGQKREPTAICVVQLEERADGRRSVQHYLVRHLERMPHGTTYPKIAERVSQIATGVRRKAARRPTVFVDATGLGQPIVDLIRQESTGVGTITPVFFTHGDQRTREGTQLRLGKAYLVARLQMLLQTGRLHLPRTPEAEKLAQELLDYEIQVESDANDRYGAFRVGTQDDLVTALGLAVHQELRRGGVY